MTLYYGRARSQNITNKRNQGKLSGLPASTGRSLLIVNHIKKRTAGVTEKSAIPQPKSTYGAGGVGNMFSRKY